MIVVTSKSGKSYEFEKEHFASGGMKDVHWGKGKSYVVAFYRDEQDYNSRDRIENIVNLYRDRIFNMEGGDYWKGLLVWPYDVVEHQGKMGIVCPVYDKTFFFKHGSVNGDMLSIKGKEKEGKWFASASNQNRFLDAKEKGDLQRYIQICLKLSRAVKRLHSAGLAHSDLSYKNVLVDPEGGNACIIDNDSLVVPGKYPPDVVGTPDFIAPEVMATKGLPLTDPKRKLPSIATDKHALAVLIYMYMFFRHPLRGGKTHDLDPTRDEELLMGEKALFVEHPSDLSNRPNLSQIKQSYLPWADVSSIPYSAVGPYLKALFVRSFIEGLHEPAKRPVANEWEIALVKTLDLLQPCENDNCQQKWFVFDNSTSPSCPYCKTPYRKQLPVLDLYSSRSPGKYLPDNHRIMVYHNQYFYQWHVDRSVFPNERLSDSEKKPVGYFVFHQNNWVLVNQNMPKLKNLNDGSVIAVGSSVKLVNGLKLQFGDKDTSRVAAVQIVN